MHALDSVSRQIKTSLNAMAFFVGDGGIVVVFNLCVPGIRSWKQDYRLCQLSRLWIPRETEPHLMLLAPPLEAGLLEQSEVVVSHPIIRYNECPSTSNKSSVEPEIVIEEANSARD